nr:hypothetical protein [uncultured Desulfobacter sp.]
MKKHIALAAAAIFITSLFAGVVQAGPGRHGPDRSHHHRHNHQDHHNNDVLKGLVVGAGALILGTAIAQSLNRPNQPVRTHAAPVPPKPHYYTNHHAWKPNGHWAIKKIWVAPVYETRWNPAHYDPRGKWVRGRHQQFLVAEGYWKKEKVWVGHRVTY